LRGENSLEHAILQDLEDESGRRLEQYHLVSDGEDLAVGLRSVILRSRSRERERERAGDCALLDAYGREEKGALFSVKPRELCLFAYTNL